MHWDDLKIVLSIARHSKLARAAEALRIDETTVSRRLKRIESDINITLFERGRHGHVLTPQGKTIFEHVEKAELELVKIDQMGTGLQHAHGGTIRISVAEGFGAIIMPPLLRLFHKEHPNIQIELISGSGFLSLSRREADIAIGLSKTNSKHIVSEAFLPYKLHVYASSSYLAAHKSIQSPSDMKTHTLIGYVDDLIYAPELRYFEESLPNLTPSIRSTSILAQYEMVKNGMGLAILPDFIANQDLRPILENEIVVDRLFWLRTHKDIVNIPRIQTFIKFLKASIKSYG